MTGQSTYRGDIALIRIDSGKSSAGVMYRGGPGSSQTALVKEMWSRSPQNGDYYCTGGASSGEQCNWAVESVGGNYYYHYPSGVTEIARHVTVGRHYGYCIIPGDSGGPVYTVRSDGNVAAKGIVSGAYDGRSFADLFLGDPPCENVFTDIWDAYWGFPGVLTLS